MLDDMDKEDLATFDCLVLSGGGSKGAYGAGVAKALYAFYELKEVHPHLCFIGTSAGALTASVLAATNPDQLIRFWVSVTNRQVLGVRIRNVKFQTGLGLLIRRNPFSVYPSGALSRLITANTAFDAVKNKHLIIAATNYTTGELKAFYVSRLVDAFLEHDSQLQTAQRRLAHFGRIGDQTALVSALLASTAIPIFFPPVRIGDWYIDGGVGNHTPTREAAYFLRYLEELNLGQAGTVYCVSQDPPRIIREQQTNFGAWDILKRTLDVYHHVHMEPIIKAWFRINLEVREHTKKVDGFVDWVRTHGIRDNLVDQISARVREDLGRLGGATQRRQVPLIEVEPSAQLGDTLDFYPGRIRENIQVGYMDMLNVLRHKGAIDDVEHGDLSNQPLFPGGV